jgi:predicted amidophosphoribosyltransferase
LADEHKWLKDGFEGVTKTRAGEVIKEVPYDERTAKVAGLYAIDKNKMPTPKFGFLIIDDVFETGSTVGGLCKTLEKEYPGVPRYIIALTHLHATERMAK